MRATTSGGEPGALAAMMRIGLLGQAGSVAVCPTQCAPITIAMIPQVANARYWLNFMFQPRWRRMLSGNEPSRAHYPNLN
jgi:hypothetical protein